MSLVSVGCKDVGVVAYDGIDLDFIIKFHWANCKGKQRTYAKQQPYIHRERDRHRDMSATHTKRIHCWSVGP